MPTVPNMSECSSTSDGHMKSYVEECKGERGVELEEWTAEEKQAYLEEWRAEGGLELERWITETKEGDREPSDEDIQKWRLDRDNIRSVSKVGEYQRIMDNFAKVSTWTLKKMQEARYAHARYMLLNGDKIEAAVREMQIAKIREKRQMIDNLSSSSSDTSEI